MTELQASLARDLPSRLRVGKGTALFLTGSCSAGTRRIGALRVVANGAQHPVLAHGMPTPRAREGAGDRWWAIVPIPAVDGDTTLRVGLHAELADGTEANAKLGEIELSGPAIDTAASAHGNGGASASDGGNGHRTWRPKGGSVIAIAMATHQPPLKLFKRQIESIRKQSHENWVCVISDDASNDDRLSAMRDILGDDLRFRLHPAKEQLGVYGNFERALQLVPAEAEYVALCDQDDRWHPDKLATLREVMGPDDKLAYSDMRIVAPDDTVISDTYWSERRNNHTNFASLLIANTVTGSASMFRREVLDFALPFPQELAEQRHDHWVAIVAMAMGDIVYLSRPLQDYVQHDDASLGHRAANEGAPSSLAKRVETVRSGGVLARWGWIYFQHYRRLLLAATVVKLRFGGQLARDRAKAVRRVLASDSLRGVGWLWARSIRARFGASETMERDRALVRAIAWLRIAKLRARLGRGRQLEDAVEVKRLDLPPGAGAPTGQPLAVQVDGLHKSFRVPLYANQTVATRVLHPRTQQGHRMLPVLKDISFEIAQGEFFGIIGRNGSGKSTLLKLMASIYRADRGTIRVGGQIAPIIELGLGFHPELAARDNLVVQGVMMGLTRKQSEARFEKAMSFAGLEGFETMKLRNYSSGMKVRLAFAIMVEVDGDVMMIDEVLAVGDSAFQRKCRDIFQDYKDRGKTVIIVSHQMTSIQEMCDRVLLLEGGRIERIGDPDDAARRYLELAVAGAPSREEQRADRPERSFPATIVDLWIGDLQGDTSPIIEASDDIRIHAVIETQQEIEDPCFRFEIRNQNRARIFSPPSTDLNGGDRLAAGERLHLEATVENRLTPDTYILSCAVNRRVGGTERAVSDAKSIDFAIPGDRHRGQGLLALEHDVRFEDLGKIGPGGHEERPTS